MSKYYISEEEWYPVLEPTKWEESYSKSNWMSKKYKPVKLPEELLNRYNLWLKEHDALQKIFETYQ